MMFNLRRLGILLTLITSLMACSILPRSGPTTTDVYLSSFYQLPIIPIDLDLATRTKVPCASWPSSPLKKAICYDVLGMGDKIEISIWENATEGLYTGEKKGVAHLEPAIINASGKIFIPYVGNIQVAGLSPDALQKKLTHILKNKMMDPQVEINSVERLSKQITIQGAVAKPGIFELKPGRHDLISLLGEAGGSTLPPELTEIRLERQGRQYQTTLLELFQRPMLNLNLYPGDHLMASEMNHSFSALGATGVQKLIKFPKSELSLIEALALANGLSDDLANPSHVFLLRFEHNEILHPDPERPSEGCSQVIYAMNMRNMQSVFAGQQFQIRDGDLIIATNAPYTNVRKILSSLSPAIALGRTTY